MYEANSTDAPFSLLREVQEEEFPVAIRDLHPFYSYQFMVAAVTVKPGPFSDEVACTLPEDGMVVILGGHKVNSQYCHCVGSMPLCQSEL